MGVRGNVRKSASVTAAANSSCQSPGRWVVKSKVAQQNPGSITQFVLQESGQRPPGRVCRATPAPEVREITANRLLGGLPVTVSPAQSPRTVACAEADRHHAPALRSACGVIKVRPTAALYVEGKVSDSATVTRTTLGRSARSGTGRTVGRDVWPLHSPSSWRLGAKPRPGPNDNHHSPSVGLSPLRGDRNVFSGRDGRPPRLPPRQETGILAMFWADASAPACTYAPEGSKT
jgi:hypothetical protein